MQLVVKPDGSVRCVYSEELDLRTLGRLEITRASAVEPTEGGRPTADLGPVGGPILGPFGKRSEALAAEVAWLKERLP